ncbi:AzlC family ABC transporter permease [Kribbella sp. NBC_01245]|uniref:AzlC family ABC transporter permease n=1 Tax=Kribbella sp. NBC_01245 TaxID=2903578 RepID=UPI002E2C5013|nr:AzlC family ABC transporter permease [Kribbella sp. NBC_01245]
MNSLWRTLDRGTLRDIGLLCVADAVVGASFGAIAVSGGLDTWVPIVMSVLVFAGGAQFAAIGIALSGGSAIAAVVTGLLLNARLMPYSLALADVLGSTWRKKLVGAQILTDESAAFALQGADPAKRGAAFWTSGLALFAVWNISVVLGAIAGNAVGDTEAFGLDTAFPVVLLALVMPALRERRTRNAALAGAVVAVAATPFLPAGLPVLVGLVGLFLARKPPHQKATT